MVMIEHNLDVIKNRRLDCDLGPEGGTGGGQIIAQEPLKPLQTVKASHTGRFLKDMLS